jgi:hypothetical protein
MDDFKRNLWSRLSMMNVDKDQHDTRSQDETLNGLFHEVFMADLKLGNFSLLYSFAPREL